VLSIYYTKLAGKVTEYQLFWMKISGKSMLSKMHFFPLQNRKFLILCGNFGRCYSWYTNTLYC